MIEIKLDSATINDALKIADDFCKNSVEKEKELCFKIKLVYEELLTNIFKHSIKLGSTFVKIEIKNRDGTALIVLVYDGGKFDPTNYRDKRVDEPFSEKKEEGGFGLFLVAQFSKRFEYERIEGLNKIYVEV